MSFNGIGSGMIKIAEDTPSYGKSMALGAAAKYMLDRRNSNQ